MKREFLLNFKVGDQPLPKDIIDAIMAENGRDIEAAKVKGAEPFADYDHIKEQLTQAKAALDQFKGVDVADLQDQIQKLQKDLKDKDDEWAGKMAAQEFDTKVKDAITAAKGKNPKAIAALLDLEALKSSKNQDADLTAALDALKKDSGYLFDEEKTPPPYAGGTGNAQMQKTGEPTSLSGALQERYDDKKG